MTRRSLESILYFDWNGGEEGPEDIITSESQVTIPEGYPLLEGYEFSGWEEQQTGNTYWPGDTVTTSNYLTARWTISYPEAEVLFITLAMVDMV